MSALIEVDQISRYFGKTAAVNNISFSLEKGEVLGFLGINGAGKTTTMQMLSGCLAPSKGTLKIAGFDMLTAPLLAKRQIGYLPDTPPLYKDQTVTEFLTYCAQLHAVPKQNITAALDNTLERCGLTKVATRLINNLSKGFQQRVGIAQAIIHNPSIIILDEPTVGLDPIQIKEIRCLIKELGQDHGVILSTHILSEVEETCTQVQIIHKGQLVVKESLLNLTQLYKQNCLMIKTNQPVNLDLLSNIPGVYDIVTMPEHKYHIEYDPNLDPSQTVTEMIISHGWGLQEMTPIKTTLEDWFVKYTSNPDLIQ